MAKKTFDVAFWVHIEGSKSKLAGIEEADIALFIDEAVSEAFRQGKLKTADGKAVKGNVEEEGVICTPVELAIADDLP